MKKNLFIGLLITSLILSGCEDVFFDNTPGNNPESVFNIFWTDFDWYYGQFDIRNIGWDSIYSVYRPQINAGSSDQELLAVLNNMIQVLKDGHVNLYTPLGVAGYYNLFPVRYFSNKLINPELYITFTSVQNNVLSSGFINNLNIGYIKINTFYSDEFGIADSRYKLIDEILNQFKDCDGIIIDVRSNGGGNSSNTLTIASRFADKKYLYYKQRYKVGPNKDDFSDWIEFSYGPDGACQFIKPVVVLTSRYTYSAAEVFVSAMQVLPNVLIIGDTTGGGIGNPIYRELPNGWTFRLSTSVGATADGSIIDGKGIIPDITIVSPLINSITQNTRDVMLEKAIDVLNSETRK